MAQAWWDTTDEVCSATYNAASGTELLLQKGMYHFHDGRPVEHGFRVIWRNGGRLQSRPARFDDLSELDALIQAGRKKGWM